MTAGLKIMCSIYAAAVMLVVSTAEAQPCTAVVDTHPLLNESIAYSCPYAPNLTEIPKKEITEAVPKYDYKPTATKKVKKKCWYKNKRGQKRYRMRYEC